MIERNIGRLFPRLAERMDQVDRILDNVEAVTDSARDALVVAREALGMAQLALEAIRDMGAAWGELGEMLQGEVEKNSRRLDELERRLQTPWWMRLLGALAPSQS